MRESRGRRLGAARAVGAVGAAAAVALLTSCTSDGPVRELSGSSMSTLSGWDEIEGRWEVAYAVDGEALLVPAEDGAEIDLSAPPDSEVAPGRSARWVDVATGEERWTRDDLGGLTWAGEGHVAAMVGEGSSRTLSLIDRATGASVWEVPESDLGRCRGWELYSWRTAGDEDETGDGDETDPAGDDATDAAEDEADSEPTPVEDVTLILRAPREPCVFGERPLLVEVAASDGTVADDPIIGSGEYTTGPLGDRTGIATWSGTAAQLITLDSDTRESDRFDLPVSELLADLDWTDRFESNLYLELTLRIPDRPSLAVDYYNDADNYGTVRSFRLDPDDGSVEPLDRPDCSRDVEGGSTYSWRVASPSGCAIEPHAAEGEVTFWSTDTDDPFEEWTLVTAGGILEMRESSCRPALANGSGAAADGSTGDTGDDVEAEDSTVPLLVTRSPEDVVQAHNVTGGEAVWTMDGAVESVETTSISRADRLLVLMEDADGTQLLRTLRLCSGAVVAEREVAGADMLRGAVSAGGVVTLALEETTLVATITDPED